MLNNKKFLIFALPLIFGLLLFFNANLIFAASGSSGAEAIAQSAPVANSDLPGLIKGGVRVDFILFLKWFYPFLLSAAAVLAVLMIVMAGVQWAGSMGSEQMVKDAKDRLTNAIIGLILAFAAWLILHTINPDLVNWNKSKAEIKPVNQIALIR